MDKKTALIKKITMVLNGYTVFTDSREDTELWVKIQRIRGLL